MPDKFTDCMALPETWAHQRLIECYASEIGCGRMMLIETNMHKLSETWQRINGGMFNTMRTPKRP